MSLVVGKKNKKRQVPSITKKDTRIQLDRFSQRDLRTWQKMSDGVEEYHVRLYYHLESLRKLHHDELCQSVLNSVPASIELESWVRIVDYEFCLNPLSAVGSLVFGGRFNIGRDLNPGRFPPYPVLYIASDYETGYAEKFGMPVLTDRCGLSGHELALRKPDSFASVILSGRLNNLFDASKAANLKEFIKIIMRFEAPRELKILARRVGIGPPYTISDINMLKQGLLANNWRAWPTQFELPANSQVFGRLIKDAGFDGIIYPSVKGKGKCIAIFPENLAGTDSYVELSDKAPDGVVHTKLDASTWVDLTQ